MIHPSLIQKVSLDERGATKEVVDDLKRSYNYVGPISVTKHAATDPACNTMRMIVRMSRPYWRSTDPDGDAMWDAVASWLKGKLYKLGSTMANYNKTHVKDGRPTVEYGRLEVEMKGVLFGFALPTVDELPAIDEQVARYRELLNAGMFDGLDVASVEVPSRASYAAQYAAALEAAQAQAGEGSDAAERPACADDTDCADGPAAGCAAPKDGASMEEGSASVEATEGAVPSAEGEDPAPVVSMPVVDYRVWDVVLADGTVRALDSVAGSWV